jgi:4-amino-4-deoxy-L-arabinose transferase-like glycosyltransferase
LIGALSIILGAEREGQDDPVVARRSARTIRAWARSRIGGACLVLICLALYVPGWFSLPTVDRDEARFAQTSRQMASADHPPGWVVPRIQDRARLNKPPAIYWLQAASASAATRLGLDDRIWAYRLPSVLAAIIAVLACWRAGLVLLDPRAAWLGALFLAVCPLVVWESRQARADMALLAATTVAMWMSASLLTDRPFRPARARALRLIVLWLAVAAGVFIKGPITPMIVLLAAGAMAAAGGGWRCLWRLAPLTGLTLVAISIGVWAALVAEQIGWSTYLEIIYREVFQRSVTPKEGHWGPPGYHLVLLAALFWPGSMLTLIALARSLRRGWRGGIRGVFRRDAGVGPGRAAERFLLCWIVPSWIVFELVSTKLPHYTLPLYPPIALLTARGVLAAAAGTLAATGAVGYRIGVLVWGIIGLALAGAAGLIAWALAEPPEGHLLVVAVAGGLLAAVAVVGAVRSALCVRLIGKAFAGRRLVRSTFFSIVAAAVLAWTLVGVVLPGLSAPWITRQLMGVSSLADPARDRPFAGVEFHEDSMVFETRGRYRRLDAEGLDEWLAANPRGLVVLPPALADARPGLLRIGEAAGFNYSKGRSVRYFLCAHGEADRGLP